MKAQTFWLLLLAAIVPLLLSQPAIGASTSDDALSGSPLICNSIRLAAPTSTRIANPALRAIAAAVHDQREPQTFHIMLACGMLRLHRQQVREATVRLHSRDPATRVRARAFIIRREREIAHYQAWLGKLSFLRIGM